MKARIKPIWSVFPPLLMGLILFIVFSDVLIVIPGFSPDAARAATPPWPGPINLSEIRDSAYPVPTGAYFVATNGNDSNPGTQQAPWATLQKAITTAPAGSTIILRGGAYRTGAINVPKKLTIQPYSHEKVWIKGSIIVSGWTPDGNAWRKDGWTYQFPRISSEPGSGAGCPAGDPMCVLDPNYPEADYRDMLFLNGAGLRQVLSRNQVTTGTFYVDTANDKLYIGSNPNGNTIEASIHLRGFEVLANADSTIIRGIGIAHYGDAAIRISAQHVTLEKNTIIWNGVAGAQLNGNGGGTDGVARYTTFANNGRKGLSGSADRWIIEHNVVSRNNNEHFRLAWDAAGMKFIYAESMKIRNNRVEENFATGIWLDLNATDVAITRNLARANQSIGIFFEVSSGAIIAANAAVENGVGIMLNNSSNTKIFNNTMVRNNVNLKIEDSARVNVNADEVNAGFDWEARAVNVKNNLLMHTRQLNNASMLEITQHPCGTEPDPLGVCKPNEQMLSGLDYNAYYRIDTGERLVNWRPTAASTQHNFFSLPDFQNVTGYEQHGKGILGLVPSQVFTDPANNNYTLVAGSPLKNAGVSLPSDVANALGVPTGTAVDIGMLF